MCAPVGSLGLAWEDQPKPAVLHPHVGRISNKMNQVGKISIQVLEDSRDEGEVGSFIGPSFFLSLLYLLMLPSPREVLCELTNQGLWGPLKYANQTTL